MKRSKDQLDTVYTFIEKYFYFIVSVIVITLISLTASLYSQGQNVPPGSNLLESKHFDDFKVKQIENRVKISWVANSCNNNIEFELQKSYDGINFETIIIFPLEQSGGISEFSYTEYYDNGIFYRLSEKNKENGVLFYSQITWIDLVRKYRLETRSALPKLT